MKTIVCFGELMLRLNPEGYLRLVQADKFCVSYAGAEANVAVSLSNLGEKSRLVTKLPQNELGDAALNAVRRYGVNTDYVLRGGDRLGLYYLEKGASQRASKVIYDRAGSAVALAEPSEYNWRAILDGADWLHFTGITAALSDAAAQCCLEACLAAKELGVKVSCDLNYRNKLWSREKANATMSKLMQYVDVCIANEEDAKDVFGIEAADTDITGGKLSAEGYASVAAEIVRRFGCDKVAITLRTSKSASDNDWAGMLYSDGKAYFSPTYSIRIVDRVGGGDSFGAGLIYALINGKQPQDAINFAVAASCLKHSIESDFNLVSVKEVEALAAGNASGRVQR